MIYKGARTHLWWTLGHGVPRWLVLALVLLLAMSCRGGLDRGLDRWLDRWLSLFLYLTSIYMPVTWCRSMCVRLVCAGRARCVRVGLMVPVEGLQGLSTAGGADGACRGWD